MHTLSILFVAALAVLGVFQLALALGAPLGRFAWGGQHERVLPRKLRMGSAVSIVIYAVMTGVALDRGGVIHLFPATFSAIAMWVIFGYLVLATLMNIISRSRHERFTMTPVAAVLAVLALVISLSAPPARTFEGLVLDRGSGPELCTGAIMESAPPQCSGELRPVTGWDWDSVEHVDFSSARWGEYRFTGVDHADHIEFVELVAG